MTERELTGLMYELLSPEENPECGRLYLELFDKHVLRLEMSKSELNNAEIYGEYPTKFTERTRYIDLAIITLKRFIPVEVKIEAGSGQSQCDDYLREAQIHNRKYYFNEPPMLYYLTLHGYFPERTSAPNTGYGDIDELGIHQDKIIKLTFRTELLPWLEECLKHAPKNFSCRNNLSRLLSYVRKITQRTKPQLQVEDIMRKFFTALDERFDENFCRRYRLKRKMIQPFEEGNWQREILKFFEKGRSAPGINYLCTDATGNVIRFDDDKELRFYTECYNGGENEFQTERKLNAGFAIYDNRIDNYLYKTADIKRLLSGKNILPEEFIKAYRQKFAGCIGLTELHDAYGNTIDFKNVDETLRQFNNQEDIDRAVDNIMTEIEKLLRRFIYG
ncbi:MAG: PD-(D/E)XK nuclease family protein [Selenomonadaceae bacterium]|nr:PD-(D/E)XK nuclease family protein [Selenomonadaceae bacterium]